MSQRECYTLEQLIEIRAAEPGPVERPTHIGLCEDCRNRWEIAGRALELVEGASGDATVPDRLRAALRAIPAIAPDRSKREIAVDAEPEPGAGVQVRGMATFLPSRRLYKVGDYDVDLSRSDDGRVLGQVMHPTAADGSAGIQAGYCLVYGDENVCSAPLGPRGEFELADLPPGPFDLVIEGDDVRLVLRGVTFGPGSGAR